MSFVVAIDGPAGCGKGTVTKIIAEKTGLTNIDTGSMYRCVALEALRENILPEETEKLEELLKNIDIRIVNKNGEQTVFLNKEDVSKDIRLPEVDNVVAKFAAIKSVRDKLTPIQRKIGEEQDSIMEGRDIGTVVFPNADVKIFLECSIEERAKRRYLQNKEKGINESYEEVLSSMLERHKLETEREIAPFVKAEDAFFIDTTNMSIKEVVDKVIEIIEEKKLKKSKI